MSNIEFRWMEPHKVNKIADIDRSERIRTGYRLADGELQQMQVNWDAPSWDWKEMERMRFRPKSNSVNHI